MVHEDQIAIEYTLWPMILPNNIIIMQRLIFCVIAVAAVLATDEPRYAVAIMKENNSSASGFIYFKQNNGDSATEILANIKGLNPNQKHAIHVHNFGDLTDGCVSAGAHYNPFNKTHGSLTSTNRHVGDLSNIQANHKGEVNMRLETTTVTLFG